MTFGIIGYGSFGKLLYDILSAHGEVSVYVRNKAQKPDLSGANFVSFEKAASADVVIPAVGLDSLDEVGKQLAQYVSKDTIVADVSSVKVQPMEILDKNLKSKCRLFYTHPLFGPQTVEGGSVAGKSIVVCPFNDPGQEKIMEFLKDKLQLEVIKMTAEEHDREMAWVHALTFFVGRSLAKLDPPKSRLTTGYYQKLLDLVELEQAHSIELFNTVERGNPYSAEVRKKFIKELLDIDEEIRK